MGGEREDDSGLIGIRPLGLADISKVISITEECPEAASWSKESYEKLFGLDGFMGFVNEVAGRMNGFVVGRKVVDEGEILNLAVCKGDRRQGKGQALTAAILEQFHRRGVNKVFLEVRESNATAIAFYEKQGFAKTGMRPAYYREPEEAAALMEKKLTG